MDNSLINIRFMYWHLILDKGKILPIITYNSYHRENKSKLFEIYNLFGFRPGR
jgi:hypothetical protein